MQSITCNLCRQSFTSIGTKREPCFLPCGDSFCKECICDQFDKHYEIYCIFCKIRFDDGVFPVNKLYFEINDKVEMEIAKTLFKRVSRDETEKREDVTVKDKCLYPFCAKRSFRNGQARELFCSLSCKTRNQELYA